jgi:hypothetical protein
MDVDDHKEALFNEIYDTEHIPNLLRVPGVRGVTRMAGEPFTMSVGGAEKKVTHDGPRYSAIYEIDGPHVLVSRGWADAVEEGRWPTQIRPFTHNRRHALYILRRNAFADEPKDEVDKRIVMLFHAKAQEPG